MRTQILVGKRLQKSVNFDGMLGHKNGRTVREKYFRKDRFSEVESIPSSRFLMLFMSHHYGGFCDFRGRFEGAMSDR